jgi:hypothetical protein
MMEMQRVYSSDLESVGYEAGMLYIRFKSGGLYSYSDVPESVFEALKNASSKGRYFHAYIEKRYRCRKL